MHISKYLWAISSVLSDVHGQAALFSSFRILYNMKEGHERIVAGLGTSFMRTALLARRSLSSYKWKPLLEGN